MLTTASPTLDRQTPAPFPVRLAAVTGLAAAAVLFVNAAKRAELIPLNSATQLAAPLAQALAIILVIGLAAVALRQSSKFSAVALVLNVLGLAAATGVEWVINLVFVRLDPSQIATLRAGPLGTAFVAASMIFLLGSILYSLALLRDGKARLEWLRCRRRLLGSGVRYATSSRSWHLIWPWRYWAPRSSGSPSGCSKAGQQPLPTS
ncbi:hypothetical protein QF031_002094 [Pseudarthrobacter defluvii]|nr:hypothetical protein [Pseudarthrobacter defluvii]